MRPAATILSAAVLAVVTSPAQAERSGVLVEADARLGLGHLASAGSHSDVGLAKGLGLAVGAVADGSVAVVGCGQLVFAPRSFSGFVGLGLVTWPRTKLRLRFAAGVGAIGSFGHGGHPGGTGPAGQVAVAYEVGEHFSLQVATTGTYADVEGPDHGDIDLTVGMQLHSQ